MFNTYLTLSAITDIFNIINTVESIDVCPQECFHIVINLKEKKGYSFGIHLYNEYQKFMMYYLSDKGLRFQAVSDTWCLQTTTVTCSTEWQVKTDTYQVKYSLKLSNITFIFTDSWLITYGMYLYWLEHFIRVIDPKTNEMTDKMIIFINTDVQKCHLVR